MPNQAKATTTAKVLVTCEGCGKVYEYEHFYYAYGRHIDELAAEALARQNMDKVIDYYSKQIASLNFSSIVENRPCPACGTIQSWMSEPIIRKQSWKQGLIWAVITFFLMIPLTFVLRVFISSSIMDILSFLLIFVLPLFILFQVRNFVTRKMRKTILPSSKINLPLVELHKGLLPETHWVL
jgi:hypothetical protein